MSRIQHFPPDWNMTDFHQRLRRLRTARKVTQTRVAEMLGSQSPRLHPLGQRRRHSAVRHCCQNRKHPECQSG